MTDLSAFMPSSPLVLVGCGNMGRALVRGWLTAGLDPAALLIIDPGLDPDEAPEFLGCTILAAAADLEEGLPARLLMLAVKPQVMNGVLANLGCLVGEHTIAVSIAAGVTLGQMQRGLGENVSLVRAMPNTPAAVGAGVTGLVAEANVANADRVLVDAVMQAAGKTVWVESENLMDAVTATSGSGPAYVFHMVEALAAGAEAAGLPPGEAATLARQTIIGAARLLAVDEETSASELRTRVTSPGGTTAAALDVLMAEDGLTKLMTRAVAAATKRGNELSD